jgi:hypothetical protein
MVGHTDSSLETRKLEFSFFVALDLQELKRSDVKKNPQWSSLHNQLYASANIHVIQAKYYC